MDYSKIARDAHQINPEVLSTKLEDTEIFGRARDKKGHLGSLKFPPSIARYRRKLKMLIEEASRHDTDNTEAKPKAKEKKEKYRGINHIGITTVRFRSEPGLYWISIDDKNSTFAFSITFRIDRAEVFNAFQILKRRKAAGRTVYYIQSARPEVFTDVPHNVETDSLANAMGQCEAAKARFLSKFRKDKYRKQREMRERTMGY